MHFRANKRCCVVLQDALIETCLQYNADFQSKLTVIAAVRNICSIRWTKEKFRKIYSYRLNVAT